jgi:ABC-type phosphate transport system auxiliary subunit
MTIETDEQFIQRLTSRNYELTVENDDLRTKLEEVQAECNARGIILNHNLKQWQEMFPGEIGNSWYYPGDKVRQRINGLCAALKQRTDSLRKLIESGAYSLSDAMSAGVDIEGINPRPD